LPIIALIAPVLLVITQPDLGTSILIAAGGIIVVWLAGVKIKFFAYLSIIFISVLPIAISFLKPYQKARILTFLNPDRDPLGAGYQIIQSKIAIGSGGFFGKVFILLLYVLIIYRIVKIGHITRSNFGKLYCYGFSTALSVYIAVNMGMVLGLLPIVGAPLPIMSYGGSSMMSIMLGLGIAMSCKIHKDTAVN
jgi:rod shape determining protein RodA